MKSFRVSTNSVIPSSNTPYLLCIPHLCETGSVSRAFSALTKTNDLNPFKLALTKKRGGGGGGGARPRAAHFVCGRPYRHISIACPRDLGLSFCLPGRSPSLRQ